MHHGSRPSLRSVLLQAGKNELIPRLLKVFYRFLDRFYRDLAGVAEWMLYLIWFLVLMLNHRSFRHANSFVFLQWRLGLQSRLLSLICCQGLWLSAANLHLLLSVILPFLEGRILEATIAVMQPFTKTSNRMVVFKYIWIEIAFKESLTYSIEQGTKLGPGITALIGI